MSLYGLLRFLISKFFTEATTAMLHRPSMESGTVVLDTPLEASVTSKKMSAAVLFTLEGMDLTLYQENEVF